MGMMVAMEILLQLLLGCLRCWRVGFGAVGAACSTWFFVSLMLMRRLERVERRTGFPVPEQLLDALPLARTGWELALIGAAALSCWVGVWAVRGLERQGY